MVLVAIFYPHVRFYLQIDSRSLIRSCQNPDNHSITDFVSFYHLPSTAMKLTPHQIIDAAYLFYYATTSVPSCADLPKPGESNPANDPGTPANQISVDREPNWTQESPEDRAILKTRLIALIGDALVMAQKVCPRIATLLKLDCCIC